MWYNFMEGWTVQNEGKQRLHCSGQCVMDMQHLAKNCIGHMALLKYIDSEFKVYR